MSYSLNSLKGGYIGDYIGDVSRLDYSSRGCEIQPFTFRGSYSKDLCVGVKACFVWKPPCAPKAQTLQFVEVFRLTFEGVRGWGFTVRLLVAERAIDLVFELYS